MRRESARKLRQAPEPAIRAGRSVIARYLHRLGIPVTAGAKVSVGYVSEEGL